MRLVQILADIICDTLLDPKVLAKSWNRKGAFTRNCGKLPYWTLMKLLLKNVKNTISASVDGFFHELCLASGTPLSGIAKCSQQAFSKARSGINCSIFKECFERVLDFLCSSSSLDFHARFMGVCRIRIRSRFSNEIDAIPEPSGPDDTTDCVINLWGRNVRVIKLRLSSGIVETLISNDFSLNKNDFRQSYFLRCPVEENYKLIKEKIGLTCFRGYCENSVLQEFWISMLLANLPLAIKRKTDGIIDETINKKGNVHKYMTNMNELVGYMSRHFDEYMDADTYTEKFEIIRCIFDFAISHRVQDKKGCGESSPRTLPRNVKHHYNNKTTH